MNRTPLREYFKRPLSERLSQTKLAEATGITQGAIPQMLKSNRDLYVIEYDDGSVVLEEIRRIQKDTAA